MVMHDMMGEAIFYGVKEFHVCCSSFVVEVLIVLATKCKNKDAESYISIIIVIIITAGAPMLPQKISFDKDHSFANFVEFR